MLLILVGLFASCKKDEKCNCGTVMQDGVDGDCYYLVLQNDCTNNRKQFCFDRDFWLQKNVGDKVCVDNQAQW